MNKSEFKRRFFEVLRADPQLLQLQSKGDLEGVFAGVLAALDKEESDTIEEEKKTILDRMKGAGRPCEVKADGRPFNESPESIDICAIADAVLPILERLAVGEDDAVFEQLGEGLIGLIDAIRWHGRTSGKPVFVWTDIEDDENRGYIGPDEFGPKRWEAGVGVAFCAATKNVTAKFAFKITKPGFDERTKRLRTIFKNAVNKSLESEDG